MPPLDIRLHIQAQGTLSSLRAVASLTRADSVLSAIRRTMFEVRDALVAEQRSVFKFSGASTQRFFDQAYKFDVKRNGTAGFLGKLFVPNAHLRNILSQHVRGARVKPDRSRLVAGTRIAVPVFVRENQRGRVPPSQTPLSLVRRGKGFINRRGNAFLMRQGGKNSSHLVVAYALTKGYQLAQRFRFLPTAHRAVRQHFVRILASEARRELRTIAARNRTR